jgi:hypothetical protein
MKFFAKIATCLAALGLIASPALAQTVPLTNLNAGPHSERYFQADLAAPYTNATTSYTDITGMTVTLPKTSGALTGNSQGSSAVAQAIRVCYYADVVKATATTGTIQVVSNGTAIVNSRRSFASAAGQQSQSLCYTFVRPTAAAMIVKLQGVSGDTNVATVSNMQFTVEVLRIN